jgi:hypothetical protein
MGLTIVGAVLLITGLLMVFVSEALRLKSQHSQPGIARVGEFVAISGLGIGVVLLAALTLGRADRSRADRSRVNRSRADRSRVNRGRADRSRADRSRVNRGRADRGGRGRRRRAGGNWTSPPRDAPEEWLSPLRTGRAGPAPLQTPGAEFVHQRVRPSWPEPPEVGPPASGDYADDGWHPDPDVGWNPGPAYVWNPRGEDDWESGGNGNWGLAGDEGWRPGDDEGWRPGGDEGWRPGGDEDWRPGDDEAWDTAASTGITAWSSDDRYLPDRNGREPSPATDQRNGHVTGPQPGYLNVPEPRHASGPQPAHAAGPEHGQASSAEPPYLAGPEPGYASDPESAFLAGPEPGHASDPEPPYLAGPEPALIAGSDVSDLAPVRASDLDAEYVAGPRPGYAADPEGGYLGAGPMVGDTTGPRSAGTSGPAYRETASPDLAELDGTREDDDTSPIPVISDPGQSLSDPRRSEPVPAPQPFSVWEPRRSKPVPAPESFSVWEPAPKPSLEPGRDGASDEVYQPAHAEPPPAATQEKIEQIKDLYMTAEAIGDDALGKHFDQLRQRQRSLIREFFEKAGLGSTGTPTPLGGDSAQNGASSAS